MNNIVYDMRQDLHPGRIAVAMWDFSWLTCHHPGGAFADYDRVTDELLERNFNTVRIECFPLIIGLLEAESSPVTFAAQPEWSWGPSPRDHTYPIVDKLTEFMSVCRAKGIFVILSTWNLDCVEFPDVKRKYTDDKAAYWQAWTRTLDILGSRGLLEHVLYVDLDQEFPFFSPFRDAIEAAGSEAAANGAGSGDLQQNMEQAALSHGMPSRLAWNEKQLVYAHDHLKRSLDHFQHRYPGLRFTFSQTSFWKEVRATGLKSCDVLELHFWMNQDRINARTGFNTLDKKRSAAMDYGDYQRRMNSALKAVRPMLLHDLHNQLKFARAWSEEISAPVVTTEAWGPWWHMDHPDLTWNWLREWCAECNGLAAQYGLWGTTPWNYAHPYWENWKDVAWYREVNGAFLRS